MANVTVNASANIQAVNRCVVRTSSNRVYVFVTSGTSILAKKGNQDGEPSSFSTIASLTGITNLQDVGVAAAIDSSGIVHVIYYDAPNADMGTSGNLRHVTFNTSTDSFGTPAVAGTVESEFAYIPRISVAIDANNDVHAVWRDAGKVKGSAEYHNWYANNIGGTWNSRVLVSALSGDTDICCDIIIADPLSSVNADRPIIVENSVTNIFAYYGNALNATAFNSNNDITGSITTSGSSLASLAIDSNETLIVSFVEGTTFDLMIVEHNNSDNWATWQTPEDVDTSVDYFLPSIAVNDTDKYIFVEESAADDINLWKDEGSGWSEETADADLPNSGTFNDVKAKYASKNNNSPTALDYVFEDSSGNVLYNTISVGATPRELYQGVVNPMAMI